MFDTRKVKKRSKKDVLLLNHLYKMKGKTYAISCINQTFEISNTNRKTIFVQCMSNAQKM